MFVTVPLCSPCKLKRIQISEEIKTKQLSRKTLTALSKPNCLHCCSNIFALHVLFLQREDILKKPQACVQAPCSILCENCNGRNCPKSPTPDWEKLKEYLHAIVLENIHVQLSVKAALSMPAGWGTSQFPPSKARTLLPRALLTV